MTVAVVEQLGVDRGLGGRENDGCCSIYETVDCEHVKEIVQDQERFPDPTWLATSMGQSRRAVSGWLAIVSTYALCALCTFPRSP